MIVNFNYTKELLKLKNIFEPDSLRIVGGAVRNFLLKKEIIDYDLCSTFTPDKIKLILEKNNIKYLTVGEKHGTITAIINNIPFEITTLRKDIETDGRHAKVVFSDNYEADSNRRDFTMNALYLDFEGNIFDYHRGIEDLKNGIVRFIGNPESRIKEDYLRILRFFRFFSYYGRKMDDAGLENCIKYKNGLKKLSGERIKSEMLKIFWSPKVFETLEIMDKNGILSEILISSFVGKKEYFLYNKNGIYEIFPLVMVLNNQTELNQIKDRWKLSNDEFNKIKNLIARKKDKLYSTKDIKKYLFLSGDRDFVKNLVMLNSLINNKTTPIDFDFIENYDIPKFPISGHDLKELNLEPKELGIILNKLKEIFIQSEFTMTKKELLNL